MCVYDLLSALLSQIPADFFRRIFFRRINILYLCCAGGLHFCCVCCAQYFDSCVLFLSYVRYVVCILLNLFMLCGLHFCCVCCVQYFDSCVLFFSYSSVVHVVCGLYIHLCGLHFCCVCCVQYFDSCVLFFNDYSSVVHVVCGLHIHSCLMVSLWCVLYGQYFQSFVLLLSYFPLFRVMWFAYCFIYDAVVRMHVFWFIYACLFPFWWINQI